MKTVVIASNPFGYGPTGQAIALINEMLRTKLLDSYTINFIASGLCFEIIQQEFSNTRVNIINIDERDLSVLSEYISTLDGEVICVGSQNRFIVKVAKELDLKSIFIDGLGWFWDTIPESHLLADRIYWTNFPNLMLQDKVAPKSVSVIGLLQDSCEWSPDIENPFYIVSLGGCSNPIRSGLQESYLKLTMKILNSIYIKTGVHIEVVLGDSAREYILKNNLTPVGVTIHTYDHSNMMQRFSRCTHHFSVGGQSSSMEAITSRVPTTFYLPSNMSQVVFQKVFDRYCPGNYYTHWELFISGLRKFNESSELLAIDMIEQFSRQVLDDDVLANRVAEHCIEAMQSPNSDIFKLVKELDNNGGQKIVSDITNWL